MIEVKAEKQGDLLEGHKYLYYKSVDGKPHENYYLLKFLFCSTSKLLSDDSNRLVFVFEELPCLLPIHFFKDTFYKFESEEEFNRYLMMKELNK